MTASLNPSDFRAEEEHLRARMDEEEFRGAYRGAVEYDGKTTPPSAMAALAGGPHTDEETYDLLSHPYILMDGGQPRGGYDSEAAAEAEAHRALEAGIDLGVLTQWQVVEYFFGRRAYHELCERLGKPPVEFD